MLDQHNILEKIKRTILRSEPSAKVYLYGSRAKGTTKPDSDWDLLILLNVDKITLDIEKKVTDPLYDFEFETGEVISPMVYSEKEWNSKYRITSYYSNVMNEGILL